MLKLYLGTLIFMMANIACAQIVLEAPRIGEIYQMHHGRTVIMVNNTGRETLKILSVVPKDSHDQVDSLKFPILIEGKTSINIPVTIFSRMDSGVHRHIFSINTNSREQAEIKIAVQLFGLSVLDNPVPIADLGTVNTNGTAPTKIVSLSSREVPDFHVTRVVETPDFATAQLLPDGHSVAIMGRTDARWGRHDGFVKVALNSTTQPEAWIEVKADVHGEVIPSANPVEMGAFRTTKLPFVVQLKSRDGKPVKLGRVSLDGIKATVAKEACVGSVAGCAQISVKIADDQPSGRVQGKLLVELPDFHQQLPIDVGGLYLPDSVKVESLNDAMEKKSKSSTEPPPLDLKSALEKSTQVAPPPAADPPGHGPLLKWQVSNENNMYGYLIYRGDSENGPFLRVNKDIVHVGPDKGDGVTSSYAWRDDSATAGKAYWYYIGMLYRDGTKQQLSGPQEVKAK